VIGRARRRADAVLAAVRAESRLDGGTTVTFTLPVLSTDGEDIVRRAIEGRGGQGPGFAVQRRRSTDTSDADGV
jgi:hypothetical protein